MKQETQTREKLQQTAKEEFMEKGYAAASLRNICRKANVTTGALYFFFKDKEDLFGSLVDEPLKKIYEFMKTHYEVEIKELKTAATKNHDSKEDTEAAVMALNYMFEHHDEFTLLLTKSAGSRYENCTDRFVEISEAHYRVLADEMSERCQTEKIDDYTIHWISHLQILSFVQLITHDISKEEALKHINTIVKFLINGWFGIYK
ncbi:TetR/AcrR family transcriptional regulator [Acetobacterium tundrae]|uniref:TetR family transcriptional regulator n=1 Tax=Acetobacterium tundrae TaxID=132932 RepID=A0ABR6WIV2_9FIRM|nr:TetR/AcrR family transcriptional regulator [Acetobacterium tundrae]MBC3796372.1 TetR family transcriptional regulator [Acetobacterium tundrae]